MSHRITEWLKLEGLLRPSGPIPLLKQEAENVDALLHTWEEAE